MAVIRKPLETARSVLDREASSATISDARNTLLEAVKFGNTGLTARLLEHDGKINRLYSSTGTLLHTAIESDGLGMEALLLVYGASLETSNALKYTPLMLSIKQGAAFMVALIIAHRPVCLQESCAAGLLPLAYAGKVNKAAMIKLLIDRGAKVGTKASNQKTALHVAIEGGCWDAAECLLWEGANPNDPSKDGMTPLHILGSRRAEPRFAQLLYDHNANIEATNDEGATPLYCAAYNGGTAIFDYLIKRGAKLGVSSRSWSPLHAAASQGHVEILQRLLKHQVDANLKAADWSHR